MAKGNMEKLAILSLLLIFFPQDSIQGSHEKRLLKRIFVDEGYNSLERPVENDAEVLKVTFGLTLQQIIDVDEKNQIINTNNWLNLAWNDYSLRWNSSEYGGLTSINIPPAKLWIPDILMYNSASESFDGTYPTKVVVSNDGSCSWIPPGMFVSSCNIDITWFPFDDQSCELKFGAWTHDGNKIELLIDSEEGDTSAFMKNGEWDLLSVKAKRNTVYYDCCPNDPYYDVTFSINIRRRTLYYGFNLIIPCVLLSGLALLTFLLPPDAGEKVSLAVTIMLSLTVFLMIVADVLPPTSDAVPLIVTYFGIILLLCSLSVVFAIVVLSIHHRSPDTHNLPNWVRYGINEYVAWLMCMSRPGKDLSMKAIQQRRRMRELEQREQHSRSLLANVLDDTKENGLHQVKVDRDVSLDSHTCSTRNELRSIYKEIRFITDKMRDDDETSTIENEWKFAASVIDRLCVILFTAFTCLATIIVLFSAPHIIA